MRRLLPWDDVTTNRENVQRSYFSLEMQKGRGLSGRVDEEARKLADTTRNIRKIPLRNFNCCGSAFDESFFQHFFVAEPQVGDVGGAETENIFKRAADFFQREVDADAL